MIGQVLNNERQWLVETTDVLDGLRSLPDGCVQCAVTSPPYFALRDYGVAGQIGLEETPDAYIAKMVAVFSEVRRVLRDDGTLWLNIGDSYNSNASNHQDGSIESDSNREVRKIGRIFKQVKSLNPKDLMGIPWQLAFALRADGWYLRSEIIWHKPNPMPESVTDRPSKAHEQIFLLSKSAKYFYDGEAVREAQAEGTAERYSHGFQTTEGKTGLADALCAISVKQTLQKDGQERFRFNAASRNRRSVWSIPLNGYKEAHFATFPPALPETCLKAGTSLKGCCSLCGAPWERVTESERVPTRPGDGSKVHGANSRVNKSRDANHKSEANGKKSIVNAVHHATEVGNRDPQRHVTQTVTKGWAPGCECNGELWPCLILDPFAGAGTSLLVAKALGLRAIGFELNQTYAEMARRRIDRGFVESTPKIESAAGQMDLFGESS